MTGIEYHDSAFAGWTEADLDRVKALGLNRAEILALTLRSPSAADFYRFGARLEEALAPRPEAKKPKTVAERVGLLAELEAEYEATYGVWLRRGAQRLTPGQQSMLQVTADRFPTPDLAVPAAVAAELRDLGGASGAAGGFTVPPGFVARLFIALKRASSMVRAATVANTATGAATSLPLLDDTAVSGGIVAEGAAHTLDVAAPFAQKALPVAYLYSSRIVKVSFQLAQDTAWPLERWLPMVLARRIARGLNPHLTVGTGAGAQPVGLANNATVGVTGATGQTTTITYDNVVDLIASVDPEYLEAPLDEPAGVPAGAGGHVGFMGSKNALQMLRKVKDTSNAPIVTEGLPVKVLGYDYLVNPDWPVPAASAKSLAFGSFGAGYVVRQVRDGVVVLRLAERYAEQAQLGFLAFLRADGSPADAAAVRLYQHSAT